MKIDVILQEGRGRSGRISGTVTIDGALVQTFDTITAAKVWLKGQGFHQRQDGRWINSHPVAGSRIGGAQGSLGIAGS